MLYTSLQNGHPAGALDLAAVAVLGQDGLAHIGAGEIVREEFIHDRGDRIVDVPLRDPLVVKGGGGCDGKVVALVPVPFRVDPVQGEGHDGQHIGPDGVLGPGGVDLAGGHVLDVILVFHIVVPGGAVPGTPVVDDDVLGHHNPA